MQKVLYYNEIRESIDSIALMDAKNIGHMINDYLDHDCTHEFTARFLYLFYYIINYKVNRERTKVYITEFPRKGNLFDFIAALIEDNENHDDNENDENDENDNENDNENNDNENNDDENDNENDDDENTERLTQADIIMIRRTLKVASLGDHQLFNQFVNCWNNRDLIGIMKLQINREIILFNQYFKYNTDERSRDAHSNLWDEGDDSSVYDFPIQLTNSVMMKIEKTHTLESCLGAYLCIRGNVFDSWYTMFSGCSAKVTQKQMKRISKTIPDVKKEQCIAVIFDYGS